MILSKINIFLTNKQAFKQSIIFLTMDYFDFHHHNRSQNNGIYNLEFPEVPGDGLFSAGFHPQYFTKDLQDQWKWLAGVGEHPLCAAIGECGLDGRYPDDSFQAEVLDRHIQLANELRKPLIIHCVRRFSQLPVFKKKASVPMIIHGFNKKQSVADELRRHDFYLSFGKSLLQNVNLQRVLQDYPLERIFLESDTEEGILHDLYRKASMLKGISEIALINQIENNLKAVMPR